MNDQLIRTSLHEAGHEIVGKTLGRRGTLYLWRRTRESPLWAGRVRFDDAVELWSADERILVALAGTVAEVVIDPENQMTAAAVFQEANHQRTRGGTQFLSESDLELAEGFERRHVDRAFEIVRTHSEEIVDAAAAARAFYLQYPGGCGLAPP
jgi:hypothetical protein